MQSEKYTTKKGTTRYRPVMTTGEMSRYMYDGGAGFCLACGSEAEGVEPDARGYECEGCGEAKVYGLEELMLMGLIRFTDEPKPAEVARV